MKLYHDSPRKLKGNKLALGLAEDLERNPENMKKGIYATDKKEIAIAMAIISCKGILGASLNNFGKGKYGKIYFGEPKQRYVYLHTLNSKNFKKCRKVRNQYFSKNPVKPIKTEKLRVEDFMNLVKYATKEKVEEWSRKYPIEEIYSKNSQHFKRLIPFAQKIIKILQKNKIPVVIYGSFAHFYHTKDENMKVNDIDILIKEKIFPKIIKLLEKNKIKFKYYPKWKTIIIKKEKLKVEIDSLYSGYKTLEEGLLPKKVDKIDFYGIKTRLLSLKDLEEMYPIAYKRSKDDKAKLLKRIKHLEKFLGRKLRQKHI